MSDLSALQPIAARFGSRVELTIHGAFLATAGVLQCDPVAKVHLVTVKRLLSCCTCNNGSGAGGGGGGRRSRSSVSGLDGRRNNTTTTTATAIAGGCACGGSGDGVGVTISSRTVGQTRPKYFTAHPQFEETVAFTVDDSFCLTSLAGNNNTNKDGEGEEESVEDYIVITLEDASSSSSSSSSGGGSGARFFGEAYCPFSPHCPSAAARARPVRVMIQPRNTQDTRDPLFRRDTALLRSLQLDDFGFVSVSWRVRMIPHGGAITAGGGGGGGLSATPTAEQQQQQPSALPPLPPSQPPAFPLGLTLKARWQLSPSYAGLPDAYFTASVDFGGNGPSDTTGGGGDRFVFSAAQDHHNHSSSIHIADRRFQPLFLTLRSASQLSLNAVTFYCGMQCLHVGSREVSIPLPLPGLSSGNDSSNSNSGLDRDIHWSAPIRTAKGEDLGIFFATVRLSSAPLEGNMPPCPDPNCTRVNDPRHQEQFTHIIKDWSATVVNNINSDGISTGISTGGGVGGGGAQPPPSPLPDAPFSAYQPLLWESAEHIAFATARRWKRGVVCEAQPTPSHVRHIFDVLMGRVSQEQGGGLDAGVARVAAAYFSHPPSGLTAMDLKEFMVACAFNARGMSARDAARFCFVALRRDVEDAVAADEVHYMMAHSLLGRTVDMSAGELRRWVSDIIGDAPAVTFADFTAFLLDNDAVWAAFGVPVIADAAFSSAQRHHHFVSTTGSGSLGDGLSGPVLPGDTANAVAAAATAAAAAAAVFFNNNSQQQQQQLSTAAAAATTTTTANNTDGNTWRTFVIRVPHAQKAFSVTAHVTDTVGVVKKMVEESTGIKASRQDWRINGETPLDNNTTPIGSTVLGIHSALKKQQQQQHPSSSSSSSPSEAAAAATSPEVWIREAEESILLTFLYTPKSSIGALKRWQERVLVAEKVLRVRAGVQRRTLIPLSRCVLRVVVGSGGGPSTVAPVSGGGRASAQLGQPLADRHPISHYGLVSGDVIEVSQE